MAYKPSKFRIPGGGVLIPWEILNSTAYKGMTPSAAKALPFFLGKVKCGKKTGIKYASARYYNEELRFSYKEAARYGFAPSTFSGVIKEVVQRGFVDPVSRGGMKGSGLSYSWFKLSSRWKDYGTPNFVNVNWATLIPKPRSKKGGCASPFLAPSDTSDDLSTSKSEVNSSNSRNSYPHLTPSISDSEVVGQGMV